MSIAGPNSLIRLLRSPQDPPIPGGPSKLEIARQAWKDGSNVPGKADIIRDWIYSVWEKHGRQATANNAFDQTQMDLLASVLGSTSQALPPNILCLYFRRRTATIDEIDETPHTLWADGARRCVASSDAWVEVWIEMMKYLGKDGSLSTSDLVRIIEFKVRESIVLVPITKKNSLAVHNSLVDISKAFAQHAQLDTDVLGCIIYPMSSLRTAKTALNYLGLLPSTPITLRFLPRLLCALESAVRSNMYDIFVRPTSSKTPYQTYTNGKVRSFLCSAINETQAILSSISADLAESDLWDCRRDIWRDVTTWGAYVETDQSWKEILAKDIEAAKAFLRWRPGTETVGIILSFLTVAEELDHTTTNIEADVMSWCLAASDTIAAHAKHLLLATLRYHRLSQSTEAWISLVMASVDLLSVAAVSAEAQLHSMLVKGPLFSNEIWQQLDAIKRPEPIMDRLLARVQAISGLNLPSAIILDIISYLAIALCTDNKRLITSLDTAYESLLLSVEPKYRDSSFELSLAALVRLGRQGNSERRQTLDSAFGLETVLRKGSSTELREEACLWLVGRIGDAPVESPQLLDSLVTAVQHDATQICWDAVDREGLSALEHLATTEQLDRLFTLRADSELQWLLSSAEVIEMPRVINALLKATLARIDKMQSSASTFALLASLPPSALDDTMRQAILKRAQPLDVLADQATSCTIRRSLTHIVRGFPLKIDPSYWATLQSDAVGVAPGALQACTRDLTKAFIESAFESEDELDRLISSLSNDYAYALVAEVAIKRDAARVPAKIKSRLGRMVDHMADAQTQSTSARTLLAIRKLRRWCNGNAVKSDLPLQLATYHNLGPAELELLRMECDDDDSLSSYMQLLMSKSDMISQETLQREVVELAGQTADLGTTIRSCLTWIARQGGVGTAGGFAVLSELLSVRRQGTGKAILQCREPLLDCLVNVQASGQLVDTQLLAIKAFVRLRSKLLRVSDMSRIIATLSSSPSTVAIDIVHAAILTRSDLVIHVLPSLARFLCNSLYCVQEESALGLSRLLSTFGSRRSARSARDTSLTLAFSKHAPAVLVAYVRSVSRSHKPLSIATRRTLQTSVYAICNAVVRSQDRGREGEGIGTPYGLGETGEAEQEIWADLWKQWAKQRYRGQG